MQLRGQDFLGKEKSVVAEVCQVLRTQGAAIDKEVAPKVKQRIADLSAGIAVNEQRPLGVLDEEPSACYAGIILNLQTATGEQRLLLGVFAVTVLNGRIIYLYHYQAKPEDGATERNLKVLKKVVQDHIALNSQSIGIKK